MDSGKRTIIKAVLWNVMGLVTMIGVGFVMTGSLVLGGTMAIINTGVGLVCYVLYERLWGQVSWGRYD